MTNLIVVTATATTVEWLPFQISYIDFREVPVEKTMTFRAVAATPLQFPHAWGFLQQCHLAGMVTPHCLHKTDLLLPRARTRVSLKSILTYST